ncbi:FadR/GntR family transcriptional regulator [Parasphingorhabdus sp.]|uniref:FadR/GntR family transcriptional regulator n=1 Tax=Parasphingorhabdus sp. TaxID=2709688 RepID=UPI003A909F26
MADATRKKRISTSGSSTRPDRPSLVDSVIERLRLMIFDHAPEQRIGSLSGLASQLGVGIVTIQQAARVLENEGLLAARRGPNGGYYGKRPTAEVLERTLAAYMRGEPSTWKEALDMTSLLFTELAAAAADCRDALLLDALTRFLDPVEQCPDEESMAAIEQQFQNLLFKMVNRPLFELLTRVTLNISVNQSEHSVYRGLIGLELWKSGRQRIIHAILEGDGELARFEADRNNRRAIIRQISAPTE